MSIELEPSFGALADWVRCSDHHASFRLPLLRRAEEILQEEVSAANSTRRSLADQLERWRYQLLDEHRGAVAGENRRLADALDLAANELIGGPSRAPRWPRQCLTDATADQNRLPEVNEYLAPGLPMDELTRQALETTLEHFPARSLGGQRRMLLYAPLYLSSHCINHCVYCGFRYPREVERKHLSLDEALGQAAILRGRGMRHILLVGGDFPRLTTTEYYAEIIRTLLQRQIHPAVEIAPQSTRSYHELATAGACGVTLYQETYNEELYALYHPRGRKASYDWRLEGIERAAEAGIRRLGLGILLGLANPRQDVTALMRHAAYLQARFPQHTLALSLPRIHQAPEGFVTPYPVDDEVFVRLYCLLRIAFPRAELVLSTREAVSLRNRLAEICITQMSAGSSTAPGGYENGGTHPGDEQFPVCDHRSPAELAEWLQRKGFELAWDIPVDPTAVS